MGFQAVKLTLFFFELYFVVAVTDGFTTSYFEDGSVVA
jgi:hypothetical protein